MNRQEALQELQHHFQQLKEIEDEVGGIVAEYFPEEVSWAKAYDILNFGASTNPYDNTFEKLIENIQRRDQEEIDLVTEEERGHAY